MTFYLDLIVDVSQFVDIKYLQAPGSFRIITQVGQVIDVLLCTKKKSGNMRQN